MGHSRKSMSPHFNDMQLEEWRLLSVTDGLHLVHVSFPQKVDTKKLLKYTEKPEKAKKNAVTR